MMGSKMKNHLSKFCKYRKAFLIFSMSTVLVAPSGLEQKIYAEQKAKEKQEQKYVTDFDYNFRRIKDATVGSKINFSYKYNKKGAEKIFDQLVSRAISSLESMVGVIKNKYKLTREVEKIEDIGSLEKAFTYIVWYDISTIGKVKEKKDELKVSVKEGRVSIVLNGLCVGDRAPEVFKEMTGDYKFTEKAKKKYDKMERDRG